MEAEGKTVSIASLCRWFGLPRSSFYYRPTPRTVRRCDPEKVRLVRAIIDENPGYGVRRLTAMARKRSAEPANRKSVHRILKENSWQVRRRPRGQRPRVAVDRIGDRRLARGLILALRNGVRREAELSGDGEEHR